MRHRNEFIVTCIDLFFVPQKMAGIGIKGDAYAVYCTSLQNFIGILRKQVNVSARCTVHNVALVYTVLTCDTC